jgi:cobalt/nickel transport system ATP-binding protein
MEAWPVEVEGLVHRYGDRTVLGGVSFRIGAGEHVLLAGRSGAGKSTLALHLNGVLLPDSGCVKIGGEAVTGATLHEIRSRVGLVFQDPDDQLFTPTVIEDVLFGPLLQGLTREEAEARAAEALDRVGLTGFGARLNGELSQGEKRRAALATVLAMRPGVLVFDEPFANLDPGMVERVAALIASLPSTVVVISQEIVPALACCSRMIVLDQGRVAADGPAMELARNRPLLRESGIDFYAFEGILGELMR